MQHALATGLTIRSSCPAAPPRGSLIQALQMFHSYAASQLADAVHTLVVSPGNVRERLQIASEALTLLQPSHFPPDLRSNFVDLYADLTKHGPLLSYDGSIQEGAIPNTLRRIRNSTGSKLAQRIYDLAIAMKSTH